MNIEWYCKNNDMIKSEMTDSSQLVNKLLNYESESALECVNIIFSQKTYFDAFLKNIKGMANIFDSLNFRLGVVQNENIEKLNGELIDSSVIYIGGDRDQLKYLSVFNSSSCVISSECHEKYTTIGYQRHLSNNINIQSVSLSELRQDFSLAESKLRAAKSVFLRKNAIKKQDSFSSRSRITGLDVYETCQLIRYCGLSSNLEFFFINAEKTDAEASTWDIITTAIWYYLEGKINQNIDNQKDATKIFMVDCDFFEDPIMFTKSEITNRWWFDHPNSGEKIPCSENDYTAMKNGQIPDLMSIHLFKV